MPRAIIEMRDLPEEELFARLESSKEELFNLRFQLATGQLDNPMRIKQVRHDVARILTVLRERSIDLEADEAMVASAPASVQEPVAEPKPKRRRRSTPEPEVAAPAAETVEAERLSADEPSPEVTEAVVAGDETEPEGVEIAAAGVSDEELEAEALAAADEPTDEEPTAEEPAKRRGLLRRKRGDA